jgi:phosphatidylglycerophosphate synthase
LVRGWLRAAYRIGSWLGSKGVGPTAVTTAGLLLCLAVPAAALLGPAGLALGALLVLAAAVADGVDGTVALVTGRATRLGYVYDSVADRVGELAWLTAFWAAGAPGWLVVTAGAASWLHEYARARATAAGMTEIGVVTIAERPTRVLISIFGLVACAALRWITAAPTAMGAAVPVAVWLAFAAVGLAQLGVAIHRRLTAD